MLLWHATSFIGEVCAFLYGLCWALGFTNLAVLIATRVTNSLIAWKRALGRLFRKKAGTKKRRE